MADAHSSDSHLLATPSSAAHAVADYVVVARRYRPQSFADLVGQQQVSQALSNAITTNRVGHAYLFTGARGVGKTSTARILAKCLNCVQGPTPAPCGVCDNCVSIASGDDVDVLEIDGASNRGIDEIRQLRSNVNVRPSRARFKIYIIDEVHMLTVPAFNALLKTLEEPPAHVKFVFCTTDPEKIPITVLSRCQRFDFPPVATESILERLRLIVQTEGVEAEEAALQLLARRAAGSMRDSQSLLEQLLAFGGRRITEADVHAMLGTAKGGRLAAISEQLLLRSAPGVLAQLDAAVGEGVDVGQLAEQLLGFYRDMLVATVGGAADLMLYTATGDFAALKAAGQQFGLETILAAVQILDQAVARMRQSTHVRTLVEMALVRICHLEDLEGLSQLVAQVRAGRPLALPSRGPGATPAVGTGEVLKPRSDAATAPARPGPGVQEPSAEKKTKHPTAEMTAAAPDAPLAAAVPEPAAVSAPAPPRTSEVRSLRPAELPSAAAAPLQNLDPAAAERSWQAGLAEIGGLAARLAGEYQSLSVKGPQLLVVHLKAAYNKEWCDRPDIKKKLEQAVSQHAGRDLRVEFAVVPGGQAAPRAERQPSAQARVQKMREVERHPLVREILDLFDAEVVRYDEKRGA